MTDIIVKGADSVAAMEEVKRILGKDAMILSTRKNGEMVEITATDDPQSHIKPKTKQDETAQYPKATSIDTLGPPLKDNTSPSSNAAFSGILAKELKAKYNIDTESKADTNLNKSENTEQISLPASDGDGESIQTRGQTELSSDKKQDWRRAQRGKLPTSTHVDLSSLLPAQDFDISLNDNVFLFGPVPAVTARVATQIAILMAEKLKPNVAQVSVIGHDISSHTQTVQIAAECDLLGISFLNSNQKNESQQKASTQKQVHISFNPATHIDTSSPETLQILVLPSGFGANAISQVLSNTKGRQIIVSGCDTIMPDISALETFITHQATIIAQAHSYELVDALHTLEIDDLEHWRKETEIHSSLLNSPETIDQPSALPTLLRKRWGASLDNTQSSSVTTKQDSIVDFANSRLTHHDRSIERTDQQKV